MAGKDTEQPDSRPKWRGNPVYGYGSPAVQQGYVERQAAAIAGFFMPYLKPGMTVLDCGCGPGSVTLGLAEAVAPGQVTGIDLEPVVIQRATEIARERRVGNVSFRAADILRLPFADSSFDTIFTSSVLEHVEDPARALEEMFRVLKPGGSVGVAITDWVEPLISPAEESVSRFFALFEKGFNQHGGSLNRGRHLRVMLRQAGFTVTEFSASYLNSSTPDAVRRTVEAYVQWVDNWALFDQAVELGWTDRPALDGMTAEMKRWSENPDAFLAITRCTAIGQKS